jgi:hypothetical protein
MELGWIDADRRWPVRYPAFRDQARLIPVVRSITSQFVNLTRFATPSAMTALCATPPLAHQT